MDYEYRSAELAPLKYKRDALSLSGVVTQLIAVGRWNGTSLKICEKYFVGINKWMGLPTLSSARQWPGSMLHKS